MTFASLLCEKQALFSSGHWPTLTHRSCLPSTALEVHFGRSMGLFAQRRLACDIYQRRRVATHLSLIRRNIMWLISIVCWPRLYSRAGNNLCPRIPPRSRDVRRRGDGWRPSPAPGMRGRRRGEGEQANFGPTNKNQVSYSSGRLQVPCRPRSHLSHMAVRQRSHSAYEPLSLLPFGGINQRLQLSVRSWMESFLNWGPTTTCLDPGKPCFQHFFFAFRVS